MTKAPLPYVDTVTTSGGKRIYYARRHRAGRRIRLPDDPKSADFMKAYITALEELNKDAPTVKLRRINKHLMSWLIAKYVKSTKFTDLRPNTQRHRKLNLKRIGEKYGNTPYDQITRQNLLDDHTEMQDKRCAANAYIITWRALIKWAIKYEYIDVDHTHGIDMYKIESNGHRPWRPEDMARFEATFPIGTMERLAYELLAHLGARQGDIIRLGPKHVSREKPDVAKISYKTEKTNVPVDVKLLDGLASIIDATPQVGETFIVSPTTGKSFTNVDSFYRWFRRAYNRAGITRPPHGLRKSVTQRLVNAKLNSFQIRAVMGWKSAQMVDHYIKDMERGELGIDASEKLQREIPVPIPENDLTN